MLKLLGKFFTGGKKCLLLLCRRWDEELWEEKLSRKGDTVCVCNRLGMAIRMNRSVIFFKVTSTLYIFFKSQNLLFGVKKSVKNQLN